MKKKKNNKMITFKKITMSPSIVFMVLVHFITITPMIQISNALLTNPSSSNTIRSPYLCSRGIGKTYHQSMSSSNNGEKRNPSKYRSASELERQREDQRRMDRIKDVQIGKTSALDGAKDYQINVDKTQEDLLTRGLDEMEREIWELTEQGMHAFKLLQLEEAQTKFEKIYELKPSSYIWQYGIVLFYLGQYYKAAKIFADSATLFESKFGEPASEERIWRDACELKLWNTFTKKEQKQILLKQTEDNESWIAQVFEREWEEEFGIGSARPVEKRKVLRFARDLFQSTINDDLSIMIVSQLRLRFMTNTIGEIKSTSQKRSRPDWKMWKHNSWFYLGLYYDVIGKLTESKVCMKMALQQNVGSMNSDDINKLFPILHMSKRDWYDDDDFDENHDVSFFNTNQGLLSTCEEVVMRTIIQDAKKTELQKALLKEGQATSGSKADLGDRLLSTLMAATQNSTFFG